RIVITLKPGVPDAEGQAVRQGLHALGYEDVSEVRVGKHIEIMMPDSTSSEEIHQMCERFLANPLIEEWHILHGNGATRQRDDATEDSVLVEARSPKPEARQ
ncbi:MAG: phosphoribosylformylglycinamidine synthase subunit PurS, partial [Armatimonadetes bacterium]|nr:phosphoribosylformylglycinamidine synthase subunit PurS [Armatimonadota bacterium]